ncbi:Aminoacylase-1 [Lamellibrachia satsuma]|nr:Aminoacylase-1 [Lamellibrachia satsuma]
MVFSAGTVEFLKRLADELQLPCQVVEVAAKKPVVLMSWKGTDPSLPAVLLNSHTDVVPVFPEHWKYGPFDAHKDEDGNIYARGTQDMKCVGIQYIEAIRRLQTDGKSFPRTIHLSFVPDEEVGGQMGMKILINMPEFKNLNVAFALDEGLASPTDAFTVFYGERSAWWVQISCPGKPGHGSRFIEDSAAEKLRRIINTLLQFREQQEDKLKKDPKLRLGDVTSVNLTVVGGGPTPIKLMTPTEHSVGQLRMQNNVQEERRLSFKSVHFTLLL